MDVEDESGVSLLDLLVVIVENLRLLIIGPIVAGLLALGITFLAPKSYVSNAILSPAPLAQAAQAAQSLQSAQQAAAMMLSPVVLDPIIKSLGLFQKHSLEGAREVMATRVKATVGKEGLLRLDVMGETPDRAQAVANAIIDGWLKTTVPTGQDRLDLEKRLGYAKVSLESTRRLLDGLAASGGVTLNKPLTRGEAGTSLMAVGELQARYLNEVLAIPRQLNGLSREEVIKQSPTLPTEPVSIKKGQVASLASVAAGLVLLFWVFMRQAWRNAELSPQTASKLMQLRAALNLRN